MNLSDITTIIDKIAIPLIVPFVSVLFSFIITKKYNEKQYLKDQKVQRIKLLSLLRKEAELFKDFRYHNNTHRSKEFVTIKLIITSPAFNVNDHSKIIELALEMERINQNIDLSLNALTGIYSSSFGGYLSNVSGNLLLAFSNSRLMKLITGRKHIDVLADGLNEMLNKSIQEATKEALPIIDEIIKEVDRLILLENNSK